MDEEENLSLEGNNPEENRIEVMEAKQLSKEDQVWTLR